MSNPHPLADEIKKWAFDPEGWQWQERDSIYALNKGWYDVAPGDALSGICNCSESDGYEWRLTPKRRTIPAHLLPEGWVVKKAPGGYILRESGAEHFCTGYEGVADAWLLGMLADIDPEADE